MSGQIGSNQVSNLPPSGGVIGTLERIGNNGARLKSWAPGQSGNPSGRNLSVYHAVRRLASSVSLEATEKLIELMRKSDDDRVAYMAIMALLERGPGKPRDHSDEDAIANRLNIAALEPDERAAFAKLLAKLMGM